MAKDKVSLKRSHRRVVAVSDEVQVFFSKNTYLETEVECRFDTSLSLSFNSKWPRPTNLTINDNGDTYQHHHQWWLSLSLSLPLLFSFLFLYLFIFICLFCFGYGWYSLFFFLVWFVDKVWLQEANECV